jgi:DNA-binding NtrC family response regulator
VTAAEVNRQFGAHVATIGVSSGVDAPQAPNSLTMFGILSHDNVNQPVIDRRKGDEVLELLQAHPWPGNVRELKNVLQRAFILADEKITVDTLPREVRLELESEPTTGPYVQVKIGSSLADAEKRIIFATLDDVGGKKKDAADALGISLKTLYNRLKAYEQE